jgi:vancomycin resistance protein VanW
MKTLRSALRKHVPHSVRQRLAHARRRIHDALADRPYLIVDSKPAPHATSGFRVQIAIEQPIRQTAYSAGKIENLRIAAARLSHVVVPRGQVLSFWRQVGPPRESNGFKLGRSLIEDSLSADIGGGLCQISGLLYELGLRAALAVIERHPHTRDLYTEESRFTPLGLDATVVWGFKDVRLLNTSGAPIAFDFDVDDRRILGCVLAPQPLEIATIRLARTELGPQSRSAQVHRILPTLNEQIISDDVYTIDPQ